MSAEEDFQLAQAAVLADQMRAAGSGPEQIYQACFRAALPRSLRQLEAYWIDSPLPDYAELLWPWRLWQSVACMATHEVFRLKDARLLPWLESFPGYLPAIFVREASLINPEELYALELAQIHLARTIHECSSRGFRRCAVVRFADLKIGKGVLTVRRVDSREQTAPQRTCGSRSRRFMNNAG